MAKPLVIDLFCGLGGWSRAFLDEGWDAIGFDIERHDYETGGYPGQLVLQDVLTLDGRQFRGRASLIVASPPCQEFSYMAMPWSRGRQIAAALRGEAEFPENYEGSRTVEELCGLFNACFRIAGEAGIPVVVENVKGAQPWVGPARANFGSFFFWGDIEQVGNRIMRNGPVQFGQASLFAPGRTGGKRNPDGTDHPQGSWFKIADSKSRGSKNGGNGSWFNLGSPGQTETGNNPVQSASVNGTKSSGLNWNGHGEAGYKPKGFNVTNAQRLRDEFGWSKDSPLRNNNSKFDSRKAASAMIAVVPYPVAQHIARVFKP